ncbi:hypothetical protein F5H01DRAFT_317612 [Linnemannia elongata]|nr:hypothetical protein F5H01DRAFT_317611 [Linnemannia elongata]KAK5823061.1 hypothetical protein F5H01DRAFT_317612 [Linnemannia elongata]
MVAELGDKIQINDIKKYVGDRKLVKWSQDFGQEKAVEFVFIPFKCLKDDSPGFIAVEFGRIKDFQKLCHEIPANPDDWENLFPSYELDVTKDFKYGQNNEKTFRFLVFLNSSYKPFQHRFTSVAEGSEAMTTLGTLVKKYGGYADKVAYVSGVMSIAKSVVGDDLHTF